eukprot:COSAG06_NODE_4747_length_3986_cov_6.589658_6_plen_46_part_00
MDVHGAAWYVSSQHSSAARAAELLVLNIILFFNYYAALRINEYIE